MRLTLRTLLAYLDDTLEPLEIKMIGQKVAESETAQELIARIKQATRRRRITTPPATGPNSFDPNMVSDYLDNELSADQVAELEKICLESDVHLAEVAACHQILTLVLGEPATVPPTAKERMYALVQGREAIPFRKAAPAEGQASAPTAADADADEMFLLGLPFYRRGNWLRRALPLAAILLFAIVGVALWQSINGLKQTTTKPQQVAQTGNTNPEAPEPGKAEPKETSKEPDERHQSSRQSIESAGGFVRTAGHEAGRRFQERRSTSRPQEAGEPFRDVAADIGAREAGSFACQSGGTASYGSRSGRPVSHRYRRAAELVGAAQKRRQGRWQGRNVESRPAGRFRVYQRSADELAGLRQRSLDG